MLDKSRAATHARLIDAAKASCQATPDELTSISAAKGNDTIYLTTVDRDGNIVSLIQSNYQRLRVGHRAGRIGCCVRRLVMRREAARRHGRDQISRFGF